jgi:hypothetical protein
VKSLREFLTPEPKEEEKSSSGEPESAKEEYKTEFQLKIQSLPEKKWNLLQHVSGAVFGALGAATMFLFNDNEKINQYSFLITVVILLLGPRFFEKKMGRGKVIKLQVTMLIVFAVGLIASLIVYFI